MKNKICCVFNLAALYRQPIYKLMDESLKCDFYITKWRKLPFKQMDYKLLKGYKGSGKKNELFKGFYWQTDTINLIFKPFDIYILTGEPYSVSTWLILILARIMGKKTFLWSHGWYGRESKVKRKMKSMFFKLSTGVLLYGDYARNLMIEEGINPEKLVCIYNSLDYESQLKVRYKLTETSVYSNHFHNDFPTLVYIGRIQKIKKIKTVKLLSYFSINRADVIDRLEKEVSWVEYGGKHHESVFRGVKEQSLGMFRTFSKHDYGSDAAILVELDFINNKPGQERLETMKEKPYNIASGIRQGIEQYVEDQSPTMELASAPSFDHSG